MLRIALISEVDPARMRLGTARLIAAHCRSREHFI